MKRKVPLLALAGVLLLVTLFLTGTAVPDAQAAASDLFISEYIEGSGFSKAIEIYNGTGAPVDLGAGGYTLELYSNGAASASGSMALSGTIVDGDVYVVANASADPAILSAADTTNNSVINFNGDDAVVLRKSGAVVDAFGQVGFDPGSQWPGGGQDDTLRRKVDVCAGDTIADDAFDVSIEWDVFAQNTFDGLGSHTAICDGPPPGQPLPLSEGFDDCTLAGWQIISVDSDTDHTWSCNATFSNIDVNGFGDDVPADEWLITPPLNLNAQVGDTLNFRNYTRFTDVNYPQLHVLYSDDYDGGGDPSSATWTELSGINFSPEDSSQFVSSGNVDLSGINGTRVYIAFHYLSSGTGGGTAANWRLDAIEIFEQTGWVINEIFADPATDLSGDANGDGIRSASGDEFVEIVNNTGDYVDISGWMLSDDDAAGLTFPEGTILLDQCAVVVFGGGTPTGSFGNALVFTDDGSIGTGLSNSGDVVLLTDGGDLRATASYGSEGGDDQSLTLNPDITGTVFEKHSEIAEAGGALFSPGTRLDGTQFSGCPVNAKIHEIQGSGSDVAIGGSVIVNAIVTADYQGNDQLRGFFIQEEDADADGDTSTSEGIFVYCGSCAVDVAVGDLVNVAGYAEEFFGMSQIDVTDPPGGSVSVISSGNSLPAATAVDLPASGSTLNAATFENVEGMRVTFPDKLVVSEYFELARYGQLVLTVDERAQQFTDANAPSVGGYTAFLDDLRTRRIILDDDNNIQNAILGSPDTPYYWPRPGLSDTNYVRGGDSITNLGGVLHWSFAGQSGTDAWRIRPVDESFDYTFTPESSRPANPDAVGGSLKVASFNVLNYFSTIDLTSSNNFGDCGPSGTLDCRGADSDAELVRQQAKIDDAIVEMDADIIGLMEIENNESASLQHLVDGLNAATAPGTYAYIDTGTIGTDAIKVAFIYQTATTLPVGNFALLTSDVDGRFKDELNRPALAQTFSEVATGGQLTVVVNHLKSKGSDCNSEGDPDIGDGQGNCNLTRTMAAEALVDWLAGDPTDSNDADFLIIGDLNSYRMEDPITALKTGNYSDLLDELIGADAYSYLFDGQLGYLDHSLANSSLFGQVTGVTPWHINADEIPIFDYNDDIRDAGEASFERESSALDVYEPDRYRASDHDPVITGLDLAVCETATPSLEELWPVNHKMVPLTIEGVSDAGVQLTNVQVYAILQDEPVNGDNDGNTSPDGTIGSNGAFELRAERDGESNGRVYHVYFTADDGADASCSGQVTVYAPLSKGKYNIRVDDGPPYYDSTQP